MTEPVDVPLPAFKARSWYSHYQWLDAMVRWLKAHYATKDEVDLADSRYDLLAAGEANMDRRSVTSATVLTTGNIYLGYFTARRSETITRLRSYSGGTAAGATPTTVQMALYQVNADETLTLLAQTANDPTIFAATYTAYTRNLDAPVEKVAGQRYATAFLIVTPATLPTPLGAGTPPAGVADTITGIDPRLYATISGQTALPASITNVANTRRNLYMELLP